MPAHGDAGTPPTVVFLVGFRQSGTTILSSILGEIEGVANLGEAHNVWGGTSWPKCGCGRSVGECPQWEEILRPAPDRSIAANLRQQWLDGWRATRPHRVIGRSYASLMAGLYRSAADVTGSRVLVDASKKPAYAALLAEMEGITSHVVHVVRDPRGGLWSQLRSPARNSRHGEKKPIVIGRVAKGWMQANLQAELALRRHGTGATMRLRYEDFVDQPQTTLRRILSLAAMESSDLPVSERVVDLGVQHTPGGNKRVRFRQGPIELRKDEEWRSRLTSAQFAAITGLTAPLLHRYRYPLRRVGLDGRSATNVEVGGRSGS